MTFDNATSGGADVSQATPLTFSHTNAGDFLFVPAFRVEQPLSVTYAGVAMRNLFSFTDHLGRELILFGLAKPATGANNVVVTPASGSAFNALAASYSGGPSQEWLDRVGSSDDASSKSSFDYRVNPARQNCWGVLLVLADVTFTPSGCVSRVTNTGGNFGFFDTNGALSGAAAMTLTFSLPTTQGAGIVASVQGPEAVQSALRSGRSRRQRAGWSVSSPGSFF